MAEDKRGKIHPPPPPSTPAYAPWEDVERLIKRLDRLIALMERQVAPIPGAPIIITPGAPVPTEVGITVSTPWTAGEPIEIYKESNRNAGTFYTPRLIDWRRGKRLVIKVTSTLDVAIQIQVVGNIRNSIADVVEIGPSLPCAAKSNIQIGLAWDDFCCYVGCKIVLSSAPTDGTLTIEGCVQG